MNDRKHIDPKHYISISQNYLQQLRLSFDSYAQSFRKPGNEEHNKHMELKQQHTYKVVNEVAGLGEWLGMNNEQLAFLKIIALLHDIGRFEQYTTYQTFADAESENHSEIAIRVIKEEEFLTGLTEQQVEVIYRCILNHNVREIPIDEPEVICFYSQVLRDADKLDIWRVAIQYDIFHKLKTETFPDTYKVPETLLQCFEKQKCINLKQVDSYYDSILFRLSWIFDLNFPYSLQQFHARNYAKDFISKLPESGGTLAIEKHIEQYVLNLIK